MDPTRGADDARQEGVGDTRPRGVGLPVAVHLGPRCGLEKLVGLGVPERPVEADIGQVIATELMRLASPPMLAPLMTRSPCPILPFCFFTVGVFLIEVALLNDSSTCFYILYASRTMG